MPSRSPTPKPTLTPITEAADVEGVSETKLMMSVMVMMVVMGAHGALFLLSVCFFQGKIKKLENEILLMRKMQKEGETAL